MKLLYQDIWGNEPFSLSEPQKKEIQEAISTLPETDKIMIELYYEKQMNRAEIAKYLHCSFTTVNNKLHKINFRLKRKFNPSAFDKAYSILYPETGKPSNPSLFL